MGSKKKSTVTLATSTFERFKVEEVHRRELKNAPYNPRKIDSGARERLKAGLADVGLVEPLVWNRTTGHLLSGHQRIGILDELEGNDDYRLDVAVVELDERKERALNVFFNNASSQGEYDMAALESLVRDLKCDLTGTGFEKEDLSFLVNEIEPGATPPASGGETLEKQADDLGNQVVIYFPDAAAVQEFSRRIGKPPGERYVKGEDAAKALGISL